MKRSRMRIADQDFVKAVAEKNTLVMQRAVEKNIVLSSGNLDKYRRIKSRVKKKSNRTKCIWIIIASQKKAS